MAGTPERSQIPTLTYAALAAAILVAAVAWSVPRSVGDLWIGLAAGRDIVAGRLGTPDDWAFTTAGRAWINQNWGAHLVTWLAWSSAGATGLLVLKALLIGALIGATAFVGRLRGAGWAPALLAASGVVLAGNAYFDLRPNLFTLVMAPLTLALIHRSAVTADGGTSRAALLRIALAGAVVLLWANLHGGFVLGLLMLWLWAAAHLVRSRPGDDGARARVRAFALVAAATTLLSGVVTPFGFTNLTATFRIVGATGWHEVREWQPIWFGSTFDNTWGFWLVVGVLLLLTMAGRGFASAVRGRQRAPVATADPVDARRLFEIAVVLITLALALRARRFAPLALVMMAPLLAVGLERAAARFGAKVLTTALVVQVAGIALLLPPILHTYDPANPRLRPGDTLFDRMHSLNSDFPVSALAFVNANRIGRNDPAGLRALTAWEWEGFCRLNAPQLKVMMGGRAQQIYTSEDLGNFRRALGPGVVAETRARGISLALLHAAPEAHRDQIALLLGAGWVTLFMDPPVMLLVDADNPAMRALLDRAEADALTYPDERTHRAARAWVELGALGAGRGSAAGVMATAAAALEADSDPTWCGLIANLAGGSPVLQAEAVRILEAEVRRLEAIDPGTAPLGERALATRRAARTAIATLNDRAGHPEAAATARAGAEFDGRLLDQLVKRWRLP